MISEARRAAAAIFCFVYEAMVAKMGKVKALLDATVQKARRAYLEELACSQAV